MAHIFEPEIAAKYSVEEAIVIQNLDFWLNFNRAHEKYKHKGRYWVPTTVKGFGIIFPYWTHRQIHNTMLNLRGKTDKAKKKQQNGIIYPVVLFDDSFNKKKYDKSLWYTFTKPFIQEFKSYLSFCKNAKHLQQGLSVNTLLQFCNKVLDEEQISPRPEKETLLQFCNKVLTYQQGHPELDEKSLLQFCKMHFTILLNGVYKIVKPIQDINKDIDKDINKHQQPEKTDDDGVDDINFIFSKNQRKERITTGQITKIIKEHELKSGGEILKAVKYLSHQQFYFAGSPISNVIGFLIGTVNGGGRSSSCFVCGECLFPEPIQETISKETISKETISKETISKETIQEVPWEQTFSELSEKEQALIRGRAASRVATHKAHMPPEVYADTLNLAVCTVFQEWSQEQAQEVR